MKRVLSGLFVLALLFTVVNCQNKKVTVAPTTGPGLRSVYFDFDSSFIRHDQVSVMQGNAAYLKGTSSTTTLEGHCDERGTNEYNLALGQRRADSARSYLMNLGVSGSRMRTVSYGEEKPVCYEHNEICWQKNRRVDFRR